jgi:tetratricopeptide (TPR) repeat protein
LQMLVHCLRSLQKTQEADRLFERVDALWKNLRRYDELVKQIGSQPESVSTYHEAGVVALRLGRPDTAVRWWESALRTLGDHRPTHLVLAEHFEKQGDAARAELHRRAANDLRAVEP